jgi:succinylglutamate desuccinylase
MSRTALEDYKFFEQHQNIATMNGSMIFDSGKEGPEILVIGGTHGNEPSGVKAIIHLYELLKTNPSLLVRGKVHFLLANPKAYLEGKRYIDYDLNRSFLSEFQNHREGRRANEIREYLDLLKLTAVIDLHSVSASSAHLMVYNKNNRGAMELASSISPIDTHFAFYSEHIEGLLVDECSKRGADSIVVECGNHLDTDAPFIAFFHIIEFLKEFLMLSSTPEWGQSDLENEEFKEDIIQYELLESIHPVEGFEYTRPNFETGDFLKKGEIFATSPEIAFTTSQDCYMVMPHKIIRPCDHDAGFLCTKNILKRKW